MYHQFIINPTAGKNLDVAGLRREIEALMAEKGEDYRIDLTEAPGHAESLARACAEAHGEPVRIYAIGGDGTLNEVVNGAAGHDHVEVACCPRGSGNDFVRLFGADAGRFRDLRELVEGEAVWMDLMECNGRLGLNICSAGLDARVCVKVAQYKKLPLVTGSMAYILALIVCVLQGIRHPYRVEVDGEMLEGPFVLLAACNGRWYGGGFNPVRDAIPDDGVLEFILVKGVSRITFARLVKDYAAGRGDLHPDIIYRRSGRSMKVWYGKPSAVNVDGETTLADTLTCTLSDRRLRVTVPRGATWTVENA